MADHTLPTIETTDMAERDLTRSQLLALRALGYQPVTMRARLITDHGELQVSTPATHWTTLDLVERTYR